MKEYQVEFLVKHEHGLFCFLVNAPNKNIANEEGRKKLFFTFPKLKDRKTKTYNIVVV